MFIDTHTHLDLISNESDKISSILETCKKEQVSTLFNISVKYQGNFISRDLAEKHENIYFSVGIHASEADNYTLQQIEEIKSLIEHEKCIGLGETGVDLYRDYSKKENQIAKTWSGD